MRLLNDTETFKRAMGPYLPIHGLSPDEWPLNPSNIVLTDGDDNLGLFEYCYPGVYTGHYFFNNARGKRAIEVAKKHLTEAFSKCGVYVVIGLTPLEKLGARWLNKKLGFTSHGVVPTEVGPCELVILTKKEWETMSNE